jgi:23S rRNA-/tRNA-specific pseudouridylate synthase
MDERYRDPWLVVVDKPAGLPSQRDRAGRPGVYELLGESERYVGLHHRLDTAASGLLLLSLDRRANRGIAEQLQSHSMIRRYTAVVLGDPGDSGSWDGALDGKRARTWWRALRRGRTSLLELKLDTGRTHQIRRHALEAGHPLLGDRRYGGAAAGLAPRMALHAHELRLEHPLEGCELVLESPAPEAFASWLR